MNLVGETQSTFEALQKFVGLTWSRLIALVGPAIASTWFYCALALSAQSGALASPLSVLSDLAVHFDANFNWPADAAAWLDVHGALYAPALVAATVLACLAAAPSEASGAWSSLSTLLLLVAVQIGGLGSIAWFLVMTLFVMSVAIVLDRRAERSADDRWISIPSLSFKRWVTGPGAVVGLPPLLPLLVIAGMVQAFRIEEQAYLPPATGAVLGRSAPAGRADGTTGDNGGGV